MAKLSWTGVITAVQPRIRLQRSFDERSHSYLGYVLLLEGSIDGETASFAVAVGKGAHAKHCFRMGMELEGKAESVADARLETAEYYKASGLNILRVPAADPPPGPPFTGVPPELETYRARGHRRLDARTYAAKCTTCIWGCRMPVVMIIDHWNPSQKKYRFETFCYGPKSCAAYRSGPECTVPGRKGMSWTEENWVDEQDTAHREADE